MLNLQTKSKRQKQSKSWRSTLNAILHKRSGWTHAAKAIREYGLSKLEQRAEPDDTTEHVSAIGQFASGMAKWLINFAWRQHADYQGRIPKELSNID